MASVTLTIRRDNGVEVMASGTVDDALVVDMAGTLAALMFDAATTAAPAPAP